MTTWRSKGLIGDALDFFLNCTAQTKTYAPDGCDRAVIISFVPGDWVATIEECVRAHIQSRAE